MGLLPPVAPPLWIYDAAVLLVGGALALSSPAGQQATRAAAQSLSDALSRAVEKIKAVYSNQENSSVQPCPLALAQQSQASANDSGGKPKAGPAPKPEDLEGKTPEEIDKIMKEKGWPSEPTRDGEGTGVRYPNPDRPGEQVRVMPGKSTDPNPVKQGPYGRISAGGKVSSPIPLKGNPTLK